MTKNDLINKVAERTGLTQTKANEAVQAILDEVQGALVAGQKVEFRNFGVFRVALRAERTGRNPADAAAGTFTIPAKNVVKFRTGAELDKALNSSPAPAAA